MRCLLLIPLFILAACIDIDNAATTETMSSPKTTRQTGHRSDHPEPAWITPEKVSPEEAKRQSDEMLEADSRRYQSRIDAMRGY